MLGLALYFGGFDTMLVKLASMFGGTQWQVGGAGRLFVHAAMHRCGPAC